MQKTSRAIAGCLILAALLIGMMVPHHAHAHGPNQDGGVHHHHDSAGHVHCPSMAVTGGSDADSSNKGFDDGFLPLCCTGAVCATMLIGPIEATVALAASADVIRFFDEFGGPSRLEDGPLRPPRFL